MAHRHINHLARLLSDHTHIRSQGSNIIARKGDICAIMSYSSTDNQVFWVKLQDDNFIRVPMQKIEVLQESHFTDANSAGRMFKVLKDFNYNGFVFTAAGHIGQVRRLSTDNTHFIVDIPYGPDVGRQDIRIPIGHAKVTPTFPSENTWVYRRFKFSGNYTCLDSNGNVLHYFLKDDDKACIRKLIDNGRTLLVTTPEKDEGRTLLRVSFWAGITKLYPLEDDLVGYTARALRTEKCIHTSSDVLERNSIGIIKQLRPIDKNKEGWQRRNERLGNDQFKVLVKTFGKKKSFWVPLVAIEAGVPFGQYHVVMAKPPVFGTPAAEYVHANSDDMIDNVISGLLKGLDAENDKLPESAQRLRNLYNTGDARRQTIEAFKGGLHRIATDCIRSNKTLHVSDLKRLPDVIESDRNGIYVRIYEDFPKDSPHFGLVYVYVGQTKMTFRKRDLAQQNFFNSSKKSGEHAGIARVAKKRWMVGIWFSAPGSIIGTIDNNMMDLMETLFVMLLRTYSSRIFAVVRRDSDDPDTPKDKHGDRVGGSVEFQMWAALGQLLDHIAEVAFKNTGFSGPTAESSKVRGINVLTPLLPWKSLLGARKRRWVRQKLDDRYVFTVNPSIFKSYKGHKSWRFKLLPARDFEIVMTQSSDPGHGLKNGTKVWLSVEIMFKGSHEVPYFRIPKLGCTKNFTIGNSIGVRLVWLDEANQQYYTRFEQYEQSMDKEREIMLAHTRGAITYAFFMNGQWGNTDDVSDHPAWYPKNRDLINIDMLILDVDHFQQECKLYPNTAPRQILPAAPTSLETAGQKMRQLRLENVNGPWQGFGHVNLDDDDANAIAKTAMKNRYILKRTLCDFCLFVDQYQQGAKCERADDANGQPSNRCKRCVLRRLPCSWTYIGELFGNPWTDQQLIMTNSKGKTLAYRKETDKYTERFNEVDQALQMLSPNLKAQKARKINDPTMHNVATTVSGDLDDEIEAEADLREHEEEAELSEEENEEKSSEEE